MNTALVVYQAWLCPQVWCCLIHHEGFSLLDSSENYPLIICGHLANTHQDYQSVMNLPPIETYPSSICGHQPSWNCQVIQTCMSNMHLVACSKKLIIVCSMFLLNKFFSAHLIRLWKEMHWNYQWSIYHPYLCGEVRLWASKQMAPQSVLVGVSFQHSFKCNYAITSFKSYSYVGDDKPRWRYEDIL